MPHLLVFLAALLAAALTLVSGFGLNTVLLPVFLLLAPEPVAVAAVGAVHMINNVFRIGIVGRWADWSVVARFGIPALVAAAVGAFLLLRAAEWSEPVATYRALGRQCAITPVRLILGGLICLFALLELWPRFARIQVHPRWLPLGGALSGFFGGLSGHQGALRSIFLLRTGMTREAYTGTSAACSMLVDLVRLIVYAVGAGALGRGLGDAVRDQRILGLVIAGGLGAIIGSLLGRRYIRKASPRAVKVIIGAMLLLSGAGIASGLI